MKNTKFSKSQSEHFRYAALVGLTVILTLSTVARAQTESVPYSFTGASDGYNPQSSLILDAVGNLYGTTTFGGVNNCPDFGSGCGAVFELSPNGTGGWTFKVVHEFGGGSDGGEPYSGLTLDAAGNLYGTASVGGNSSACSGGCGTVYKLAPNGSGGYNYSRIHSFNSTNGANPMSNLQISSTGALYGATYFGGSSGYGVVFRLSPTGTGGWTEVVLHNFTAGADGGWPNSVLIGSTGTLYGTTYLGGTHGHCLSSGCGVVFRLTSAAGGWRESVIHSFIGNADGANPSGVIADGSGNLFVTAAYGGDNSCGNHYGCGTVFKLSPSGSGYSGTPIFTLSSGNGAFPFAGPTLDSAGNLYGTTSGGGANGVGTVFEMSPVGGTWNEKTLYSFTNGTDGGYPYSGVVLDSSGDVFGATLSGGIPGDCSAVLGCGVVYKITP